MSRLSQLEFMKVGKNHSSIYARISEMDLMLNMVKTIENDTEKLKHVKVVEVGKNTVIAGLVAIAGSTKIGNNCMIGGSTAIAGHLKIGDNVRVAGHTGVASNIKDGKTIQGQYAFDQKDFLRSYIIFKRLPKMYETLQKIEKQLQ